ncbi:hypothetical protein PV327_002861 [Microctonus hyperodae]|uniref:EGF-like domain-containing protein n=1 Tax=Microctonus hyperodae TaxID=165561 RepID=A0AA39FGK3_MICHY|nr:hypothetical protein PV327_002861 [Microctonus hyperodae]
MARYIQLGISLFYITALIVFINAQQGVKNGHYHRNTTPYSVPTNETGYCGCVDGDCIAPRVCRCRPGYILNEARHRCEAVCEGGCLHGQCSRPGVCSCDPGYIISPRDRESCVPDCGPNNCNGGQCVSPGVCSCRPGYIRDSITNECTPECRNGCPINSRCTAPDRCVCNPGFEMDHYDNRCVISSGSYDGNNNNNNGGDHHQEQGHCDRQCINGVCMGYNICSCNDGYTPDPRDSTRTRCIASCPGGCINGICSAPNFCICHPGYTKDRGTKGSQRCVPRYNY